MFIHQNYRRLLCCLLLSVTSYLSSAQQQPDTLFVTRFKSPNFNSENSPVVLIDGMHNNLHQLNTGFKPFAVLAEADGYTPGMLDSYAKLEEADILVIVNPINKKNQGNWKRPIHQAFENDEIDKINTWVKNGGNLLLIADHMPFAGAASNLAGSFGFEYCDGFAQLAEKENQNDVFSRTNGRLPESPVTNGSFGKPVSTLTSFTGSSFSIPENAIPVMKFLKTDRCLEPEVAWQFNDSTKASPLSGKYQGALLRYGAGKIAVFGEAAMFTAQTVQQDGNTFKVGFNSKAAPDNVQFVRNVLLWLAQDINGVKQSSTVKEILSVNREMEATFNDRNYADVANYYTKDGVMLGNNTEVKGRENLRAYWSKMHGAHTWELSNIEIKKLDGNYALQRGNSVISWRNEQGEDVESKVIFSLLWHKTEEGWKIMLDHYSPR